MNRLIDDREWRISERILRFQTAHDTALKAALDPRLPEPVRARNLRTADEMADRVAEAELELKRLKRETGE